ncbi:hypothetical protein GTZ99_14810 [Novosphingobium sp. FSY-8]|uniref:TolA-binding protein n=1 Tax=Novosphingobium ovatum TaxID=1908523 RepID=A0ABW9XH86_9SPHN|nr:hypothetical protein [Novosphingobium ovatum]NBC37823.1 hypothetical protein [Novosphingobium ovatum]
MKELRLWHKAGVAMIALVGVGSLAGIPALAQDGNSLDLRLRKIEAEVKALQRQVFPGGDPQFFPRDAQQGGGPAPAPATTAVTDLLTRMDAMEAQNARLTAQVEELSNRVRMAEARAAAVAAQQPVIQPQPAPVAQPLPAPQPAPLKPLAAPKPAPAGPVAKPSAARVAAVKAIVKPDTGDVGEDEYTYGYKLWEAKFYPEAAQQLKLFVDRYPNHKRISFARNLLGRALLDDGRPNDAALWFAQNYRADRRGARASDSLLLLADTMVRIKDTNRACIALAEFADHYQPEATGRLKGQYDEVRTQVKCN